MGTIQAGFPAVVRIQTILQFAPDPDPAWIWREEGYVVSGSFDKQLKNWSADQLINLSTDQLINLSTDQLINSSALLFRWLELCRHRLRWWSLCSLWFVCRKYRKLCRNSPGKWRQFFLQTFSINLRCLARVFWIKKNLWRKSRAIP